MGKECTALPPCVILLNEMAPVQAEMEVPGQFLKLSIFFANTELIQLKNIWAKTYNH